MPAVFGSGTALFEEDLVGFNRWLCVTRLQSIGAFAGGRSGRQMGAAVCDRHRSDRYHLRADLAPWFLYRPWLQSRRALRLMAYTQLATDTAAMAAGLFFVHTAGPLFHFAFLLIVVPASMIEAQCGW